MEKKFINFIYAAKKFIKMAQVGFTTGSLYRSEIAFEDRIKLYSSLGADAIELGFATPKELFQFNPSKEAIDAVKKIGHVSIHAPWKKIRYNTDSTSGEVIAALSRLCGKMPINGIVVHPDTVEDFTVLEKTSLPFLIENMDSRKKYGTHPEHIRELKEHYHLDFVFDVQHASEHDSTMNLAKELVEVMGDRLKHMHVSGHNEFERHIPVHLAANRKSIAEILKLGLKVPKILEGIIFDNFEATIKNELNYVRSYERF